MTTVTPSEPRKRGGWQSGWGSGARRPAARRPRVTWTDVVIRAPRLAQLKRRVEFVRDDRAAPYFCASEQWYGTRGAGRGFHHDLAALVGPHARPADTVLGIIEAYQVATERLRALLPPCRACTCGIHDHGRGWSR